MKVVSKQNPEAARWARREAEALRGLAHESVCSLLDAFEDGQSIYLVLELIRGHDLFEELALHPRRDEACSASILRQVLEALGYLHGPRLCIVHRDVKPENVMLGLEPPPRTEHGPRHVKLVDFGLAVGLDEDGGPEASVQTRVVGTAAFLAPEALREGVYSRGSDMWAAGVLLQLLLTPEGAAEGPPRGPSDLAQSLTRLKLGQRLSAREALGHPWLQAEPGGQSSALWRPESVLSLFEEPESESSRAGPPLTRRSALGAAMAAFDAFDVVGDKAWLGSRLSRPGGAHGSRLATLVAGDAASAQSVAGAGGSVAGVQSPSPHEAPAARKMHGHRRIVRAPTSIENQEPNSLCKPTGNSPTRRILG